MNNEKSHGFEGLYDFVLRNTTISYNTKQIHFVHNIDMKAEVYEMMPGGTINKTIITFMKLHKILFS